MFSFQSTETFITASEVLLDFVKHQQTQRIIGLANIFEPAAV